MIESKKGHVEQKKLLKKSHVEQKKLLFAFENLPHSNQLNEWTVIPFAKAGAFGVFLCAVCQPCYHEAGFLNYTSLRTSGAGIATKVGQEMLC